VILLLLIAIAAVMIIRDRGTTLTLTPQEKAAQEELYREFPLPEGPDAGRASAVRDRLLQAHLRLSRLERANPDLKSKVGTASGMQFASAITLLLPQVQFAYQQKNYDAAMAGITAYEAAIETFKKDNNLR
jgi:hypothetical protein